MPLKPASLKPIEVESDGPELGVNPLDLSRIPEAVRAAMLGGKLDLERGPIRVDAERPDEVCVAFRCDLLAAAALLDVIRGNDRRAGDFPTRAYVRRRSWSKLPGSALLSVVRGGRVSLNPEVFAEDGAEPLPPPAERVEF